MNELLREIQEDMRQERLQRIWHSFGKLMVAASIVVVLVTIGVVVMQNNKRSRAMEQTSQLMKGFDRLYIENYDGASELFGKLAADPHSRYYPLAALNKARAELAAGHKKKAAEEYAALAARDGEDIYAGMAAILASDLSGKPLPEPSGESAFYASQREWRAWQLLDEGKKDEAAAMFLLLRADLEAPPSLRQRADEVLRYIAPEKLAALSGKKDTAND